MGTYSITDSEEKTYDYSTDGELLVLTQTASLINYADAVHNPQYNNIMLMNEGLIVGAFGGGVNSMGSIDLDNDIDGRIIGKNWGVRVIANGSQITNYGSITGNVHEGVHVEGSGEHVANSGTISGPVGLYLNTGGGSDAVVNAGLIMGQDVAVYKEGGGSLSFRNSGTIEGDVTFIDGTNTFDGRKGTIDGAVNGGTGADKILAGSDGETIGGGKGHDRLYGGAGADTFAFASFGAADTDIVVGFDTTKDLIQLDHTVFTHLVAGDTPAFSVGVKATSATDFLFYNASSGVLSYDSDGSGTTHPAYAVATLAKGLALTAKNVIVI